MSRGGSEQMSPARPPDETEHGLRLLVENLADHALYLLDPEGRVWSWNPGAVRLKGFSRGEVLGKPWQMLFSPEDVQAGVPHALLAAAVANGRAKSEGWRVRRDGSRFWASSVITALRRPSGELEGFGVITHDDTERRTAEAQLRRANRLYEVRSEIHRAIVRDSEPATLLEDVCRILVDRGGFRGAWVGVPDDDGEGIRVAAHAGVAAEDLAQLRATLADGPLGRESSGAWPLLQDGIVTGTLNLYGADVGAFDDPAERALLEELAADIAHALDSARRVAALQEARSEVARSERRFRKMIEHSADVTYLLDADGTLGYVSESAAAVLGFQPEQLRGLGRADRVHPDDVQSVRVAMQAVLSAPGARTRLEARVRHGNGGYLWMEGEFTNLLHDPDVAAIVVNARDVSERRQKEQELRELADQLERRVAERTTELASRNHELETFTYTVSHDLKAPLRGIDGYARLLAEGHAGSLDAEGLLFLENIRSAATHMSRLIDDLLAYSRVERRSLRIAPLNVREVVDGVLAERAEELRARAFEVLVSVPSLELSADREGLQMAVRNLVDNALKFTREVATPRIEVGAREQAGRIVLWMTDNGIGFEQRFADRIFEIFHRLQGAGEVPGTGVGLAIVRRAIERMGGSVRAEGTPGHGATFSLELPR